MFTARMNYCYEYRTIIRWSRQLQTILVECKQELQKSWYRCSCTHRSLFIAQAAEHWSVTAEWKVCRTNPDASLQTQHSNQLQIHKAMKRSKWTGVVRGHSQESCLYSSCDNQRYRTYHRHVLYAGLDRLFAPWKWCLTVILCFQQDASATNRSPFARIWIQHMKPLAGVATASNKNMITDYQHIMLRWLRKNVSLAFFACKGHRSLQIFQIQRKGRSKRRTQKMTQATHDCWEGCAPAASLQVYRTL